MPLNYLQIDRNSNSFIIPMPSQIMGRIWSSRKITRREYPHQRYRSGSSSDSAINLECGNDDENQFQTNETSDLMDDFIQIAYSLITMALEDEITAIDRNGCRFSRNKFFFIEKKIDPRSNRLERVILLIRNHCQADRDVAHYLQAAKTKVDQFGFMLDSNVHEKEELKELCFSLLNIRARRFWTIGCGNLKHLIREHGIPNQLRSQIWMAFIEAKIGQQYDIANLLHLAQESSQSSNMPCDRDMIVRQIELDLNRTMPSHILFTSPSGLDKLRSVLIAYSLHVNPCVGYCQAMNFIAALLLIIFDGSEAAALMGLICIIDHYFPPHYYDEHLTGARSDQFLLRDLLLERVESEEERQVLSRSLLHQITNSLTLNWFLSLFHGALPWQTRLHLLDCFWVEGVKVFFRFSIALIEIARESFQDRSFIKVDQTEVINTIKEKASCCYDVSRLKRIAFRETKIPKRKHLAVRRSFYVRQIVNSNNIDTNDVNNASWARRASASFLRWSPKRTERKFQVTISCDNRILAVMQDPASFSQDSTEVITLFIHTGKTIKRSMKTCNRRLSLFGVTNDGEQLLFYSELNKKVAQLEKWAKVFRVGFKVKFAFHDTCLGKGFFIGRDGIVCKIDLDQLGHSMETISLDHGRCTVLSAAYDHDSRQMSVYLDSDGYYRLLILDTITLDLYNWVHLDPIIHHISVSHPFIFIATRFCDNTECISVLDSNMQAQNFVQNKDSVITMRSFTFSPASSPDISLVSLSVGKPSSQSTDAIKCDGSSSLSYSPSALPSSSNFYHSHHIDGSKCSSMLHKINCKILIVLFSSAKLLCIEMAENRVIRRRSTTIDKNLIDSPLVVGAQVKCDGNILVTLFSPENKLITIAL